MQSPRGAVQSPRGVVQSPRGAVESPRGVVQSPRGVVQSPRGVVQSPRGKGWGNCTTFARFLRPSQENSAWGYHPTYTSSHTTLYTCVCLSAKQAALSSLVQCQLKLCNNQCMYLVIGVHHFLKTSISPKDQSLIITCCGCRSLCS